MRHSLRSAAAGAVLLAACSAERVNEPAPTRSAAAEATPARRAGLYFERSAPEEPTSTEDRALLDVVTEGARAAGGSVATDRSLRALAIYYLGHTRQLANGTFLTPDLPPLAWSAGVAWPNVLVVHASLRANYTPERLRALVTAGVREHRWNTFAAVDSPCESGEPCVVVLGVHAQFTLLENLPRRMSRFSEGVVHVRVRAPWTAPRATLLAPDGSLQQLTSGVMTRDELSVPVRFGDDGHYRLELHGGNDTGGGVLANLHVYVGSMAYGSEGRSTFGPVETNLAALEARVLALVNEARQRAGVAPLQRHTALDAAARAHSQRMFAAERSIHRFEDEPDLSERIQRSGVTASSVGENIAASGPSAQSLHDGLMNSPAHRVTIVDPRFTHLGIGAAGSSHVVYLTEDFARIE